MKKVTIKSFRKYPREVGRIVKQLKAKYHPLKVVLFGSFARGGGDVESGSDIDLFIIKDDVPRKGVDRVRELDSKVRYSIATDFIVYTTREVRECIENGDPFVRNVMEQGQVLYEAA